MSKGCTVCQHAQADAIDQALADAVSLRQIASAYGVAKTSLLRHRAHLDGPGGPDTDHKAQPGAPRPAVSPALRADLRLQVAALRQQADQLRRAHRSYHEYPSDTLLLQMASLLANVVDALWPAEG